MRQDGGSVDRASRVHPPDEGSPSRRHAFMRSHSHAVTRSHCQAASRPHGLMVSWPHGLTVSEASRSRGRRGGETTDEATDEAGRLEPCASVLRRCIAELAAGARPPKRVGVSPSRRAATAARDLYSPSTPARVWATPWKAAATRLWPGSSRATGRPSSPQARVWISSGILPSRGTPSF